MHALLIEADTATAADSVAERKEWLERCGSGPLSYPIRKAGGHISINPEFPGVILS